MQNLYPLILQVHNYKGFVWDFVNFDLTKLLKAWYLFTTQ